MPLTHHTSISVQALTPKLNPRPLPTLVSRLMTLTMAMHKWPCNSQHYRLLYTRSEPKQPSLPENNPCKVRLVFSKPVHAVRARGGPRGLDHGPFKASLAANMCTAPVGDPTHPFCWQRKPTQETIFSAQCAVWCNQKCTTGFNGFKAQLKNIVLMLRPARPVCK